MLELVISECCYHAWKFKKHIGKKKKKKTTLVFKNCQQLLRILSTSLGLG